MLRCNSIKKLLKNWRWSEATFEFKMCNSLYASLFFWLNSCTIRLEQQPAIDTEIGFQFSFQLYYA